jgi:transcription elongation factor GreA
VGRAGKSQRFRAEDWRSSRLNRTAASRAVTPAKPTGIQIGATIRVREIDSDQGRTWTLVPKSEAEPGSGKLSIDSPIGRGLRGRDIGDSITVATPRGERRFVIEDANK